MPRIDRALIDLRHRLHRAAEPSGAEKRTAAIVREWIEGYAPDRIVDGIGGHGLAAVWEGGAPGPRVLIRCELDALPIPETLDIPHASDTPGVSHKCGHDGHMAIVSGLAPLLRASPPARGAIILLFQPGEETGTGADLVLADGAFASLAPDMAFALHNLPGYRRRAVVWRNGVFAAASSGLIVDLHGRTAHAAEPQHGRSPALAVAELINAFSALPQFGTALDRAAKVTVIHARVGEIAFGTSPGEGTVMATLRAHDQAVMDELSARCEKLAIGIARSHGLEVEIRWDEVFPSTENDPGAVRLVVRAAGELGLETIEAPAPFPWSEDFGNVTRRIPGALFGLGAGRDHPALHHPTYDFPDEILRAGISIFGEIVQSITAG
ncbi:MAG: amidohydrolase [Candidatus Krumholzibacteriota bacterium]|nr:amidohydrolase [Candidatus Krumholzibacteriota bacterium]